MSAALGYGFDDLTKTCWSLIGRLHSASGRDARDALAELALRYWYPVYAYVRCSGRPPETAQDIVQGFFRHLGEDGRSGQEAPRGRFREWLLERLRAFLATSPGDAPAGTPLASTPTLGELEGRHRADAASGCSPEQAYQRGYALQVLARSFKALRTEARQTGRGDMYDALEPFLARDPCPGDYEAMARRLQLRPLTLVLALKRLRQRFRELVHAELVETTESPVATAAEQQILYATLVHGGNT